MLFMIQVEQEKQILGQEKRASTKTGEIIYTDGDIVLS